MKASSPQRRWQIYGRLKNAQRRRFLRDLSQEDGLGILLRMQEFAQNFDEGVSHLELRKARIENLVRVHRLFNKVRV